MPEGMEKLLRGPGSGIMWVGWRAEVGCLGRHMKREPCRWEARTGLEQVEI